MNSGSDTVVVIGRVQGAYGVKGWVRLMSYTDPVENLLAYSPWLLECAHGWQAIEAVATRPHKQGFVAELSGVADRSTAEQLQGRHIGVVASVLPPPDEDEYYWRDLIGLEVVNCQGLVLGTVAGLLETGASDVLVVDRAAVSASADGAGLATADELIPFARQYVTAVDVAGGRITVDWDPD